MKNSPDVLKNPDMFETWLFSENIRIQSEKQILEEKLDKLEQEKQEFKREVKKAAHRIKLENDRLKQERKFMDLKFKILEDGFLKLSAEQESFEKEKKQYKKEQTNKKFKNTYSNEWDDVFCKTQKIPDEFSFFKGVTNPLGLKKRYKDLIKIFHPDNLFGDNDTIVKINYEYEKMKELLNYNQKCKK